MKITRAERFTEANNANMTYLPVYKLFVKPDLYA